MRALIDTVKKPLLNILIFFTFLYAFTKLFGPIPFAINSITTSSSDLFSVTGTGKVNGAAKSANFSVGVTETASTSNAAQDAMNKKTNEIVAGLKNTGIADKDIKTTNYSINPNYDYATGGQGKITGYTASQNLEVKTDSTDAANKAIDAATQAGANVVNGVQFELSTGNKNELEMEATKNAIADAKKKAQDIAELSGIRLRKVMNIQVNPAGIPPIMFQAKEAAGTAPDTKTDLQPGQNEVSASVTLFYQTL